MTKVFVICMAFLYIMLPGVSAAGSLTDNGNGTVTDSGTLLTWQQGESSSVTWYAALSYCEGLTLASQTDWRLPNIKELSSLVDETRDNPTINTTLFPGANSSYYWSSSSDAYSPSYAWCVNFLDGFTYYGTSDAWSVSDNFSNSTFHLKANSYYVRCVRGGQ